MKTTAIKAIIALRELSKLGDKQVDDFNTSFALYKLKKALGEIVAAFDEEKKKTAEKFGGEIENDTFNFPSNDAQNKFIDAINTQAAAEIDVEITPIDIAPYKPTANQIELIVDFISEV